MTDYEDLRKQAQLAGGYLDKRLSIATLSGLCRQLIDVLEAQQKAIDELERKAVDIPRLIGPGPHEYASTPHGDLGIAFPGANYFVNERQPKTFDDIHQLNRNDDAARGNVPWGDQ